MPFIMTLIFIREALLPPLIPSNEADFCLLMRRAGSKTVALTIYILLMKVEYKLEYKYTY